MITSEDIKALEQESTLTGTQLMENAGKAAYDIVSESYPEKNQKILVACYHGNNGGDGFVVAHHLAQQGHEVDVLFLGDEGKLSSHAASKFKRINDNPLIQFVSLESDFEQYTLIVDAILGIGIQNGLRPELLNAINLINQSKAKKISLDVPSGMHPDTGTIPDTAVNADLIVTFHDMKPGLENMKDKVKVVDIGL